MSANKKPLRKRTALKKREASAMKAEDLWIAPKSNLKGDSGDRAWNDRMATPTGSRLLELADIAMGHKKPEPPKKRRPPASGPGKT